MSTPAKKDHDEGHDGRISVLEATVGQLVEGWNSFRKRSELVEGKIFDKLDELQKHLTGVSAGAGRVGLKEIGTLIGILVIAGGCIAKYTELTLSISESRMRIEWLEEKLADSKERLAYREVKRSDAREY